MKTTGKLGILGALAAALLVAGALLAAAVHAPPAAAPAGSARPRAAARQDAPWGRDTLRLHPARDGQGARPIVAPGVPAFSPPLPTQRPFAPAPARTAPPSVPAAYAAVRPPDARRSAGR